jgi:hypothetical protein
MLATAGKLARDDLIAKDIGVNEWRGGYAPPLTRPHAGSGGKEPFRGGRRSDAGRPLRPRGRLSTPEQKCPLGQLCARSHDTSVRIINFIRTMQISPALFTVHQQWRWCSAALEMV